MKPLEIVEKKYTKYASTIVYKKTHFTSTRNQQCSQIFMKNKVNN